MHAEKGKKRRYIAVNLPRDWEPHLNELLSTPEIQKQLELNGFSKTNSGLGVWIIRHFLMKKIKGFRFEHFNTLNDHVTIVDKMLRRLIDVFFKFRKNQGFLWCEFCELTECEHTRYARTLPEVEKKMKERC